MTKCNPVNERVKRKYVLVLKVAKGRGEESIDAAAIDRFDEFNRRKDFKAYHFEQARAFQAHLATSTNACRNRSTFIFCSVATQTQNRKALGERLPVRSRFLPEKSQCCPALSASSASSLITRKNSLDWPMKSPSAVKPWTVATAPPC